MAGIILFEIEYPIVFISRENSVLLFSVFIEFKSLIKLANLV